MLNLPIGHDLDRVESRANKIISTALAEQDCQLLRQLWCLLRNAEMRFPLGSHRDGLHRMREGVAQDLALLEGRLASAGRLC